MTPDRTWQPWNPVRIKKVAPNRVLTPHGFEEIVIPSWIRCVHSYAWMPRKVAPPAMVAARYPRSPFRSPCLMADSAFTMVTLLQIRMKVLSAVSGTSSLLAGTGQSELPSRTAP